MLRKRAACPCCLMRTRTLLGHGCDCRTTSGLWHHARSWKACSCVCKDSCIIRSQAAADAQRPQTERAFLCRLLTAGPQVTGLNDPSG